MSTMVKRFITYFVQRRVNVYRFAMSVVNSAIEYIGQALGSCSSQFK